MPLSQEVADWTTAVGVPVTAAGVMVALYFGQSSPSVARQRQPSARPPHADGEQLHRVCDRCGGVDRCRQRWRCRGAAKGEMESRPPSGVLYVLQNDGDATAHRVTVSARPRRCRYEKRQMARWISNPARVPRFARSEPSARETARSPSLGPMRMRRRDVAVSAAAKLIGYSSLDEVVASEVPAGRR